MSEQSCSESESPQPHAELTHFSPQGRAHLVDVSTKAPSQRYAMASGVLRMQPATLERIRSGQIAKGDVLAVADVAAVMAAKRTSDMIPLCHPLLLNRVSVDFIDLPIPNAAGEVAIQAHISVHCHAATGVEMEALCATSAALLTIYDMCKAMDRGMRIENVQLLEKHGGKSGTWRRETNSL